MTISPELLPQYFLKGDYQSIYNQTSTAFKEIIAEAPFIQLCTSFMKNIKSFSLESETVQVDLTNYVWLDEKKENVIYASIDSSLCIQALLLKPYTYFPETDKKLTKNSYRMPVNGEWYVFWGGANEFINYHYPYPNQRYAYDLIKLVKETSFLDNRQLNDHYYAFGQEVVAPASGVIIDVVSNIADQIPGEMNESNPLGNYIVIQHPNNEFSLMAHLKKESVKVQIGDKVKMGDLIALCGNSGNSSEAHIHFQVMDSSNIHSCNSLRILFNNGKEPIQGDTVPFFNSKKEKNNNKQTTLDEKLEYSLTFGEILLFIPRANIRYFTN